MNEDQVAPSVVVPNPSNNKSGFSSSSSLSASSSDRTNSFLPPALTSTTSTKSAMAASAFVQPPQHFRSSITSSQSPYALSMGAPVKGHFDVDAASRLVGTHFATTPAPSSPVPALIRRLPIDTTEEKLRIMLLFSQETIDVEMLPREQSDDPGFRSAIVRFKSAVGAQQAKDMLHGKSVLNDVEMIVEIHSNSPLTRRYPTESAVSVISNAPTPASSSGPTSRQPSRFNGAFQSLEKISPPLGGVYSSNELPNPESSASYQKLFSPQSPISNYLTERPRMSGKTLISHDTPEDDETGELLKDPVAYAENGATQQRRATAPQIPITRMGSLSLNTTTNGSGSLPAYGHPHMTPISAHGNTMSPTAMNNASHPMNFQMGSQHYQQRMNFPPVNPADQNPPCNTLYVGNLPIDTSEDELKAMFSKQRGYKRLCFRTKQNGPMCFVEFEDVSFATKALNDLYGTLLHNSVKGGIRLSFSKNPLGVRSGQSPNQPGASSMGGLNGIMSGSAHGFTTANGPPPGLTAPPGLNRSAFNGTSSMAPGAGTSYASANYPGNTNGVWSSPLYNNGPLSTSGTPSTVSGSASVYPPPYMMGR